MTAELEVIASLRLRLDAAEAVIADLTKERNELAFKLGQEVARNGKLKAALRMSRAALIEYVPYPFTSDSMNMGTHAMIEIARAAFEAIAVALAGE